ncbi:hypothetical protein [Myxosarcina sp. GI1]|uniref:PFE-CTERM domain-containing protein n=1 Tax=Myxosarcina sp. GI1 TaxID=1541065 RepID=UPI000569A92E|nr:hypothetical protein [Myxosarcina sp. GI1]
MSGERSSQVEITNETAYLDTQSGVQSKATFTWNGGDPISGFGGNGIDLTKNGDNAFLINVLFLDQTANLEFIVTDIENDSGSIIKNVPKYNESVAGYTQGVGRDTAFNYNKIDNNEVNVKNVKSISLTTNNAPSALNFQYNFVQTTKAVPFEFSPSLGIIICAILLGFFRLRKIYKYI